MYILASRTPYLEAHTTATLVSQLFVITLSSASWIRIVPTRIFPIDVGQCCTQHHLVTVSSLTPPLDLMAILRLQKERCQRYCAGTWRLGRLSVIMIFICVLHFKNDYYTEGHETDFLCSFDSLSLCRSSHFVPSIWMIPTSIVCASQ